MKINNFWDSLSHEVDYSIFEGIYNDFRVKYKAQFDEFYGIFDLYVNKYDFTEDEKDEFLFSVAQIYEFCIDEGYKRGFNDCIRLFLTAVSD